MQQLCKINSLALRQLAIIFIIFLPDYEAKGWPEDHHHECHSWCWKVPVLLWWCSLAGKHATAFTVVSRKSAHERNTLQVCQSRRWVLFWVFRHLTTKERPCHVYSDLIPSKQIVRQIVEYKEINNGWVLMAHNTLDGTVSQWAWCSSRCAVD